MNQFTAPWGTLLIVTSALTSLLVLILVAKGYSDSNRALFLLPLLLLIGATPFVIRGYTVDNGYILIHRLLWTDRISLDTLVKASYQPKAMSRSIRLCGNGGLYSITGWYRNRLLGNYRAYVTDLSRTVILEMPNRKIVVSPGRPEAFVDAIEAAIKEKTV